MEDAPTVPPLPAQHTAAKALASSSVMFVENAGQFDPRARFQVRGGPGTMWLTDDAIWITLLEQPKEAQPRDRFRPLEPDASIAEEARRGVNLKLTFPGANAHPVIEPFNRLETKVSYFIGNDPDKWRPDVPVWGGVRYKDVYPGIDLEVTSRDGRLAPRMVADQAADLGAVRLRVEGAEELSVAGDQVAIATAFGLYALPLFEAVDSAGRPIDLPQAQIEGAGEVMALQIAVGKAQLPTDSAATADSADDLIYATFLGGDSPEWGYAIALDAAGAAYVTGCTRSPDFPTTPGAFDGTLSEPYCDAFVAKLSPDGSALAYATFLGGTEYEVGHGIAVDAAGAAYVAGYTESSDFPTTPGAFDRTFNGGEYDAFVAKLSPDGSALAYATFLGGSDWEFGYGIAVDGAGAAHVTGYTQSSDFPTTPTAIDRMLSEADYDAFVTKLSPNGSELAYATFLGGSSVEFGYGIAVDGAGAAYVTGYTRSSDFPSTLGVFDPTSNDTNDAFVAKLSPDGSALAYATFLGGRDDDKAYSVAVDGAGAAYVAGTTASSDFPTTPGAFDRTLGGYYDAFMAKINPDGSALAYVTFLGGRNHDMAYGVVVDGAGAAYVTGATASSDFPTTPGALDSAYYGEFYDAFVVKLSADGSALAYATFLGGNGDDHSKGIAADANGAAYVTGVNYRAGFPTTPGAFDRTYNGHTDAFVAKLNLAGPPPTYNISGRITTSSGGGVGEASIIVYSTLTETTDASGYYTITGLLAGTYTLAPSKAGYVFWPPKQTITVSNNITGVDFLALTADGDDDGDALLNSWEVTGYDADGDGSPDVDLPAMGARPLRQDIFVEVDYMVKHGAGAHTHRPKDTAMRRVVQAFADAPVVNRDGSTGISLHVDYGPDSVMNPATGARWGDKSHANSIPFQETLVPIGQEWTWSPFERIKSALGNFPRERQRIFHYAIFAHDLGGDVPLGTSGYSRNAETDDSLFRLGASDFAVSLGRWDDQVGSDLQQAGTFMHEFGHNLGLRHGGDDHGNYEPNYLSVMNYSFQSGLVGIEQGRVDYSRFGDLPVLDEAHLDERVGLNGGFAIVPYGTRFYCRSGITLTNVLVTDSNGPIDWDCSGTADGANVRANINDGHPSYTDPEIGSLTSFDDWSALVFDGGSIGVEAGVPRLPSSANAPIRIVELNISEDNLLERPYRISLAGGADIVATPGITIVAPLTLTNLGTLTATVLLSSVVAAAPFDVSSLPLSATLAISAEVRVPVTITVPLSASQGLDHRLVVTATVQESPLIADSAELRLHVGPLAQFVAEPVRGPISLTVWFTDTSVGPVDRWLWDFGDSFTSTVQNPGHTYATTGRYSVTLTVSGPDGSDSHVRPALVSAYTPARAAFSATPISGSVPLTVTFTNESTGDFSSTLWDFGDGITSTLTTLTVTHAYEAPGHFTVTLLIRGSGGEDTATRSDYITATGWRYRAALPDIARETELAAQRAGEIWSSILNGLLEKARALLSW